MKRDGFGDKDVPTVSFQNKFGEANSKNDFPTRKNSGQWAKNRHLAPHEVGLGQGLDHDWRTKNRFKK